jgi:hypothetical protein
MNTTSNEVIDTFAVTARAQVLLKQWREDPARPHVVRTVLGHTTHAVYQLEPSQIEAVCTASEHPLGAIRKDVATAVHPVVDWRPDFAFTHVMHLALETLGNVPTFQDLLVFCKDDPVGRAALGDPARQIRADISRRGYPPQQVRQAVRWRIGVAYYSFVREVYTIAVLRATGLDVRAHPLADSLFRVDAWVGRTVLSLYIRNARFRDGGRGRKPRTTDILAGARPPFRYEELHLAPQHKFGCVHLPGADDIAAVARRIERSGNSRSATRSSL